jgi:galactoside O-acetyltransferase
MPNDDRSTIIPRRTPQSAAMFVEVRRGMTITARLNRLGFDGGEAIRTCSAS